MPEASVWDLTLLDILINDLDDERENIKYKICRWLEDKKDSKYIGGQM